MSYYAAIIIVIVINFKRVNKEIKHASAFYVEI